MIEKFAGAIFGWKGLLIAICGAFLAGNLSGGVTGYRIAEAFGAAETLRVQLEKAELVKQAYADRIEDLKATVEARDEQLRAAGRINEALASASRDVASAIDNLKQAVSDDEKQTTRRPECAYGPADFGRVQQLIEQARRAGAVDRQSGGGAGGR